MEIYTLGHSTRSFEEFLKILKKFGIELVIDVRRFPSSKKFPWFCKEELEKNLRENGIDYIHFEELGGYRKEGYENFSKSEEFKKAIEKLLKTIDKKITVILCAEWNPLRCHRWYISDRLSRMGYEIIHIISLDKTQNHLSLPQKKAKPKCEKLRFP